MVSARSRVLPRLKRTSIGFQHIRDEISNTLSDATVKILEQDYSRLEDPAILLETSESIGIWSKEYITIPPMDKPNQRLILEATFDTNNGKIGFDDVHIRTRERCSPRWHKHDRQQFNFLTIPNLWPTLDEVESSGIDKNILAARFGFLQFSNISLELCSRHCFLGSGCDVFQFVPADDLNVTQCVLAPHLRLKSHHWFQYTEKAPVEAPRTALYVLECSVAMENLLLPNHPSDNPEILQSSCQSQGVLIHEQNHLNPIYVHGANIIDPWFAFCSQPNDYLSLEFPISETQLPLGMNLAYLTTFKPIGLLRLWYRASQFETTTFDFVDPRSTETISLELIVGTADPNSIEAQESDSVLGTFDLFPDMSLLLNKAVKVNVSMSASDTGLVTFMDLLIDMPIRLGCFEPMGNGSNQGVGFIPTSCLVTCFGNGKQRYAGMTAGSECVCLDEPPSSNQVPMEKCETRCEEDNLQFCGGSGGEILVFVAACPEDQVRFEDVCLELLDNPQGVNDNSYKCSNLGMSLWYPSSFEEFQFVSKNYQGIDEGYVHVGIRAMDREFGILQSDYSISMGIPFVTHDASGELRFSPPSDQQQPLMTLTRCIVLNLTTGDIDLLEPCPNAIALCKQKLGINPSNKHKLFEKNDYLSLLTVGNRAKILDLDVVKSYSPMKDTSTMFHKDSVNSVHFAHELLPIMPDSFLEVALPRKSSIIGLVLQTHKEQFFEEFGLQYQRLSFNSPDSWTTVEWGIEPMIIFTLSCLAMVCVPPMAEAQLALGLGIAGLATLAIVKEGLIISGINTAINRRHHDSYYEYDPYSHHGPSHHDSHHHHRRSVDCPPQNEVDLTPFFNAIAENDSTDCAKKMVCMVTAKPAESRTIDERRVANLFDGLAFERDSSAANFQLAAMLGNLKQEKLCEEQYARCPVGYATLAQILKFRFWDLRSDSIMLPSIGDVITVKLSLPDPIFTNRIRFKDIKSDTKFQLKVSLLGTSSVALQTRHPTLTEVEIEKVHWDWQKPSQKYASEGRLEPKDSLSYDFCPGGSVRFKLLTYQFVSQGFFLVLREDNEDKIDMRFRKHSDKWFNVLVNSYGYCEDQDKETKGYEGSWKEEVVEDAVWDVVVQCQNNSLALFMNGQKFGEQYEIYRAARSPHMEKLSASSVTGIIYVARTQMRRKHGLLNDLRLAKHEELTFEDSFTGLGQTFAKAESQMFHHLDGLSVHNYYRSDNSQDMGMTAIELEFDCHNSVLGQDICLPIQGHSLSSNGDTSFMGGDDESIYRGDCGPEFSHIGTICAVVPNPGHWIKAELAGAKDAICVGDKEVFVPFSHEENIMFQNYMMEQFGTANHSTIFIGIKASFSGWVDLFDQPVSLSAQFWAQGHPSNSSEECVVADSSLGYRWRLSSCFNAYILCMKRRPRCPPGYAWRPSFEDSCFKITEDDSFVRYGKNLSSHGSYFNHEEMCLKDGTRLAMPLEMTVLKSLTSWAYLQLNASYDLTTGIRSLPDPGLYVGSFRSGPNDPYEGAIDFSGFTNACTKIDSNQNLVAAPCESVSSTTPSFSRAICQYTSCFTQTDKVCMFPFKFQGRTYDSCITLGSLDGTPWCPTKLDSNGSYIDSFKGSCLDSCPVNNCPLGYYRLYPDVTCYRISPTNTHALVENFDDAQANCGQEGGRLWEPKNLEALETLLELNTILHNPLFPGTNAEHYFAIGVKLSLIDEVITPVYWDGTPMPENIREHLMVWQDGPPTLNEVGKCVAIFNRAMRPVHCLDGLFSPQLEDPLANTSRLSYICEARPTETMYESPPQVCHFPFKHNGKTYQSCAQPVSGIDSEGSPWCAVQVDSEMVMVDGEFGLCQDEREIIFHGEPGVTGLGCSLPFLMDNVLYDTCTRLTPDGLMQDFWCPSSQQASKYVPFDDTAYGLCQDYVIPEPNGCSDHFDLIDQECVRYFGHPLGFQEAQDKCQSFGGDLWAIVNDEESNKFKTYVENKMNEYTHYELPEALWIGASHDNVSWSWLAHQQAFDDFTKWKSSIKNFGCPSNQCPADMALTVWPHEEFVWKAVDDVQLLPFVCKSFCPIGYTFFSSVQKCLKVGPNPNNATDSKRTLGSASYECGRENGRLALIENCALLEALSAEIISKYYPLNETFLIGAFKSFENSMATRSTKRNERVMDSRGFEVYDPENRLKFDESTGLCKVKSLNLGGIHRQKDYVFGFTSSTPYSTDHFEITSNPQDMMEHYYICQKDELWECPEGYVMMLQLCYKAFSDIQLDAMDSEIRCRDDGGSLMRPTHLLEQHLMNELIQSHGNESFWLGYNYENDARANPLNLFDNPITGFEECVQVAANGGTFQYDLKPCTEVASFLCQKDQELKTELRQFVPKPVVMMPLNTMFGTRDISTNKIQVTNLNVRIDERWVPSRLMGSAFLSNPNRDPGSYLALDLSDIGIDQDFTLVFWIKFFSNNNDNAHIIFRDISDPASIPNNILDGQIFLGANPQGRPSDFLTAQISCFQIYNHGLNEVQFNYVSKNCQPVEDQTQDRCPTDFIYYDGMCYFISLDQMSFTNAEIQCASPSDERGAFKSQLMWTEKKQHFEFVGRILRQSVGTTDFWVGLDNRKEGNAWETSHGDRNISESHPIWSTSSTFSPDKQCAKIPGPNGGFIEPTSCQNGLSYVCQTIPLDQDPDNPCPMGFISYKRLCLKPVEDEQTYEKARDTCAQSGSTVYAPEDVVGLKFMIAYALENMPRDLWLGVHANRNYSTYDNDSDFSTPLRIVISQDKSFADNSLYVDGEDYDFAFDGRTHWKGPCLFLKASVGYVTRDTKCRQEAAFFCKWQGLECPPGYWTLGHISDGTRCYSIMNEEKNLAQDLCDDPKDELRALTLPKPDLVQRLLSNMRGKTMWINLSYTNETRTWLDNENRTVTELANEEGGSLKLQTPADELQGCAKMFDNGIISLQYNLECRNDEASPICEYKSCRSKLGKQCQFPFKYRNISDDFTEVEVEFTRCATIDLHKPWCATELNADGSIAAWDYCLPDCPHDEITVACLDEPRFPAFAPEGDYHRNYTTDYFPGSHDKLLEVTYKCPEGYVFETPELILDGQESMELTLTCATFASWKPGLIPKCIPINCTDDPPKMLNGDRGYYNWNPAIGNRTFMHEVHYSCNLTGWGYPSTGEQNQVSVCQANKAWSVTEIEDCEKLPCQNPPPSPPAGGWKWFELDQTRYRCPDGMEFKSGVFPFLVSTCTSAGFWSPEAIEECVPRKCPDSPPSHAWNILRDWPKQDTTLGTQVTYQCPHKRTTWDEELQEQVSTCIFDKDTDSLHWFPHTIFDCT
ncbi:hypothetical protein TCAL_06219, partial [Tigriopus californicus]